MNQKPNILFMMTDHQRADSIGMVQCGREVTPHLNRLVQDAWHFERAYNTCPLCVPARTALATGLYPARNGVVYNDWKGETAGEWEPLHTTLKHAGYRVGHVGVDHIRVHPDMRHQGLDYFINQEDYEAFAAGRGLENKRTGEELLTVREELLGSWVEKRYSGQKTSVWEKPLELFKDWYFKEKALEFLNQTGEEPFALFTYLWAPHPPLRVPEPYAGLYDPDRLVLPQVGVPAAGEPKLRRLGVPAQLAKGIGEGEWRRVWAAHLGLVTMADEILGALIEKLKSMGVWDNTCVLFTADHGDHLGQHGMYQKMEMYEEAVKVPLVLRIPGKGAGVYREVVSHLDVKPTLCELAGAEPKRCDGESSISWTEPECDGIPLVSEPECDGISLVSEPDNGDGRSLVPIMDGRLSAPLHQIIYSQYSGNPGLGTVRRAAVTKRYKYVYDSGREHELYDLELDPHERNNVAGQERYRKVLTRLHRCCRTYHENHGDYFDWKDEGGEPE